MITGFLWELKPRLQAERQGTSHPQDWEFHPLGHLLPSESEDEP